jgi:hypothetical protein
LFAIILQLVKNGEKTVKTTPILYFFICKSSDATTLPISVLIRRVKCDFMQKTACQNVPKFPRYIHLKKYKFRWQCAIPVASTFLPLLLKETEIIHAGELEARPFFF